MDNKPLWLTGVVLYNDDDEELGWMCEGVFDSEDKALNHLPDEGVIVKVRLNEEIPEEAKDAEFVWFPEWQTREEAKQALAEKRAEATDA